MIWKKIKFPLVNKAYFFKKGINIIIFKMWSLISCLFFKYVFEYTKINISDI